MASLRKGLNTGNTRDPPFHINVSGWYRLSPSFIMKQMPRHLYENRYVFDGDVTKFGLNKGHRFVWDFIHFFGDGNTSNRFINNKFF